MDKLKLQLPNVKSFVTRLVKDSWSLAVHNTYSNTTVHNT